MTPTTDTFLHRVARRLRLVWGVATAAFIGPAIALIALVLVLVGRFRPWAWPEPGALAVAIAALVVVVAVALAIRISDRAAALTADRVLDTKDALGTALEFSADDEPFGPAIHDRADAVARAHSPAEAAPVSTSGRRWAATAVLALGAVSLAFIPNPQDDIRAERARAAAAIADEIEDLEEELDRLLEQDPEDNAAAARLEELIADLRDTSDLERADELLAAAEADLRAAQREDLLAQRAAQRGLERSLSSESLTENSQGSAAEQLDAAAGGLEGLSAEESAALAARLEELAEAQRVGNPEAAEALAAAAEALAEGDTEAAAEALAEAASAQRDAEASITSQAQLGEAGNAVASAREGLARAGEAGESSGQGSGNQPGSGEGSGDGSGEGSGDGDGEGDGSGDGAGEGQGSGQGQGQGSGQGGGDVDGNVSVNSPGGNSGRGSGSGSGAGNADVAPIDDATITVVPPGGETDEQFVDSSGGTGDTETIGKSDTESGDGTLTVPLSDVIREYRDASVDALAGSEIPPSLRDQVAAYFDSLVGN